MKNEREEIKIKKRIGYYILMYQTFRKANLATVLHKRLIGSVLLKWIYFAIPIFFYSVNIFIMINKNIFMNENIKFSYVKDFSSFYTLSILFFLSYFLSGYYPLRFDEWQKEGIKAEYYVSITEIFKHKYKSKIILIITGFVLLFIGIGAGYSFYGIAQENGSDIWMNYLGRVETMYYCVFLGVTWYHSLSLLGMALTGGFAIFWCLRDNAINYNSNDYNKNISIIKSVDILICTFSYGLFYIVGSVLFIFNDKVAAKSGIFNTFSDDTASFLLILIVLLIVILAFIPLHELFTYMKDQKEILIAEYNKEIGKTNLSNEKEEFIKKRNDIISQNLISTSLTNRLFVMFSILIPLLGVIFQGLELFGN